jgi:hypothetical protein
MYSQYIPKPNKATDMTVHFVSQDSDQVQMPESDLIVREQILIYNAVEKL